MSAAEQKNKSWQLYILRTTRGILYTGITTDVERRFVQHQCGKGAKALRGKGPLEMLFHTAAGDHTSAARLEYQIKQLTRAEKLRLIAHQPESLESVCLILKALKRGGEIDLPLCTSKSLFS